MYELKLFGSPTLQQDDVVLTGGPVQRHRLALLALLVLSPGRRMGRDKLIAYLWPERDADSSRNLLKVATYVLRAELGEGVLLSEGDGLRLNDQLLQADTVAFESALARHDFLSVTELYRGPLLDGFFLSDAPEFDEWVEHERQRLANAYASALEHLAAASEADGNFASAAEWWKRRAAHDPYDTRVALRLIHALAESGSHGPALQHAAIHERLLHEELSMAAPPELTALVEQLRQQPAVTATTVSAPPAEIAGAPELPSIPLPVMRTSTRKRGLRILASAAAVLTLSAAALWAAWPELGEVERSSSIVVLPFVNLSANPDNEYFSDGLTEEIISRLSTIDGLKVISRTSAMHYKGTRKPLRTIAGELDVAHVLEGSVRVQNGTARITAQLIDAATDDHLWTENYEYQLQDSLRVQEQIARAVAEVLTVKIGDREAQQFARRGTEDLEAYHAYQRARHLWNMRTPAAHDRAESYFQQALARDPEYADAYAGLANLYLTAYQLGYAKISEAETYSRIKWAAERALALDDQSADAHTAFAVVLWWQRNWPGAERELQRALAINPGDANTRAWYVLLLAGMGRLDEAVDEARRAHERDPICLTANFNYAWACHQSRRFGCAAEQFRRTLELHPTWAPAHVGLGNALAEVEDYEGALEAVSKGRTLWPESTAGLLNLAYVRARMGDQQTARALLQNAEPQEKHLFLAARVYSALGEPDSAFALLARTRWQWPHRAARSDPGLDALRNDPRFAQLSLRIERDMGMR